MMIDNDLINEILKIAYKAVPKKCALDGAKLIEVHNEIGELLKIKLLNKAHVIKSLPSKEEILIEAKYIYDQCNNGDGIKAKEQALTAQLMFLAGASFAREWKGNL